MSLHRKLATWDSGRPFLPWLAAIARYRWIDALRRQLEAQLALRRLARELSDALARVRTLSGMLPICAACKKIRDGEGHWHPVEDYVRARSQAQFTHGICPPCREVLYGDIGRAPPNP